MSCNAERRVPEGKRRLTQNKILVNNKPSSSDDIIDQMYQVPNSSFFGYKLALNLYNLANPNPDSTYWSKYSNNPEKFRRKSKWLSTKQINRLGGTFWYSGISNFLKTVGQAPVIYDKQKTKKTLARLDSYYFHNGYFNAKSSFRTDSIKENRAKVEYSITTGELYTLDTIKYRIESQALDSLYRVSKRRSFLETKKPYKTSDLESEKSRITELFKNNGAYNFDSNYITFQLDTIGKKNKINIVVNIANNKIQDRDTTYTEPFRLYKIRDVQVFTDFNPSHENKTPSDSTVFNRIKLFSYDQLLFKPKALTKGIFIEKNALYSDARTTLTSEYLSGLRLFKYPSIQYVEEKKDSVYRSLIAKIYLIPTKKYGFNSSINLEHSNIQNFGITGSISNSVRNIFHGAETLELSTRGNVGSSTNLANPENIFFNVAEFGVDLKLNIPKLLVPFNEDKIIPKRMMSFTTISIGFSKQINIGLDKENISAAFSYNWNPKRRSSIRVDLFNVQFVNNLNSKNYFNVYRSSYNSINYLASLYNTKPENVDGSGNLIISSGTSSFINDVLSEKTSLTPQDSDYTRIKNIEEQRIRLSENNFILATNFSYSKTNKRNFSDNNFYQIRTKIESAGTLLSLISNAANLNKTSSGKYNIFGLDYSEYIKLEGEYIKHWDFHRENIVVVRTFFGIALPFGNASYIPFSRSYYAGGSNDNRGWGAYRLGPGGSNSTNDFNEANLKIALNLEFRFKIISSLKGAFFADAGNIWNFKNNVNDVQSNFSGIKSLSDIAIGSGFGFRYDFNFFVVRLDWGFKTYNPAQVLEKRWFSDFNYQQSVINFGINYPF